MTNKLIKGGICCVCFLFSSEKYRDEASIDIRINKHIKTRFSHDRNIIVDSCSMFLCNTFSYPDNVSVFLLFQLEKRVEYAKAKLPNKGVQVHFDFLFKKFILNCFVARVSTDIFE